MVHFPIGSHEGCKNSIPGPRGIGFLLTKTGNYDMQNKILKNINNPIDSNDAVSLNYVKNLENNIKDNKQNIEKYLINYNLINESFLTLKKVQDDLKKEREELKIEFKNLKNVNDNKMNIFTKDISNILRVQDDIKILMNEYKTNMGNNIDVYNESIYFLESSYLDLNEHFQTLSFNKIELNENGEEIDYKNYVKIENSIIGISTLDEGIYKFYMRFMCSHNCSIYFQCSILNGKDEEKVESLIEDEIIKRKHSNYKMTNSLTKFEEYNFTHYLKKDTEIFFRMKCDISDEETRINSLVLKIKKII